MAASNDKTTWKTWLWALWLLGQLNIFAKPKHKPTHNTGGESARRAKPGAGGVEQEGGGGRGQMFWRTPPREGLLKRVWSDLAVSWTYNRKDWRFFISSDMIKAIGVYQCSQFPNFGTRRKKNSLIISFFIANYSQSSSLQSFLSSCLLPDCSCCSISSLDFTGGKRGTDSENWNKSWDKILYSMIPILPDC